MFKRDDYIRTKPEAVFSKWQGFTRSMLLRNPLSETAEYRRALAEYSLISRDLGPKILIGANNTEDYRKGKDRVRRYKVKGFFPDFYELGHDKGRKDDPDDDVVVANLGVAEAIRSRLKPYGRSFAHHDMLKTRGDSEFMSESELGLSQTNIPIAQMNSGKRVEEKKHDSSGEKESSCDAAEKKTTFIASIHRLSRSRPQPVSDRHDDILDKSICGVLLDDGSNCTTTPIKGRKRCTEHKGKRLPSVSPKKHIPCEVPTQRDCEETENICGVILPDMVPCRRKPVSRRKRCEDHKGVRVNAFFFTMNPAECNKTDKEDKSKSEVCTSMNEDSGPGLFCEDMMKNGVIQEDGTTSITTPIKGRKRCTEQNGKRLSSVSPEKYIPCEVPTRRESEETENICGVILPDMVPCRRKPEPRRKRCEDHKGMRVNAFSFLMDPTEWNKTERRGKSDICTSMNEDSDPGIFCEAITKNGLPCTRYAPKGSRRCWQHKDKTLEHITSENVQSASVSQVVCGVKLYDGSVCEKSPVKGRKRCQEHKGMRITS